MNPTLPRLIRIARWAILSSVPLSWAGANSIVTPGERQEQLHGKPGDEFSEGSPPI